MGPRLTSRLDPPPSAASSEPVRYTAIYLAGDLGTPVRVTAGHTDVESAKAAVERWCGQAGRKLDGEIVLCRGRAHRLREVLRRRSHGEWAECAPEIDARASGSDAPLRAEI